MTMKQPDLESVPRTDQQCNHITSRPCYEEAEYILMKSTYYLLCSNCTPVTSKPPEVILLLMSLMKAEAKAGCQ